MTSPFYALCISTASREKEGERTWLTRNFSKFHLIAEMNRRPDFWDLRYLYTLFHSSTNVPEHG